VIICKRRHLEARCRQRGTTLDAVRACIVSEDGDTITVDETHPAYPQPRPGLGDMVAAGLSAVGITKDRVSALVGGDCGCRARQAALNAVGAKYLGLPEGSNGGGDASKTTLDS
jgi:hypothetical protein